MDSDRVRARVNGLNPWPGCMVEVSGIALSVRRCERIDGAGAAGPPGTLHVDGTLACGQGAVRLLEVQAAGGRAMPFPDWARGVRAAWPVTASSRPPAHGA